MYKIIIFEGNELTGKSTLKWEFEKSTNFLHLCVDRMFITSLIYNVYKNRNMDECVDITKDLNKFINEFNPLFVFVEADLDNQLKRYDSRGEDYIKKEELQDLNLLFQSQITHWTEQYPNNFMIVTNNEEKDIVKNIKLIENKIKHME